MVVEDGDFDRSAVFLGRGQLLNVHLDGAVARNVDNRFPGKGQLRADGCRQTEAHGAETAGADEVTRMLEVVELGRPHLVLAHFGGDDGLAFGQLLQLFDDVLGLDDLVLIRIGKGMRRLPVGDLPPPRGQLLLHGVFPAIALAVEPAVYGGEGQGTVGHDGDVDRHVLADRAGIQIDVHDSGLRRKGVQPAGDPVVEAGAHGNEQIAFGDRHVGGIAAVHAEHAQGELVGAGEAAQAHEGHGHGDPQPVGQSGQFGAGAGEHDAAAHIEHRSSGLEEGLAEPVDLPWVRDGMGLVGRHFDGGFFRVLDVVGCDDVLGQIDQHRARASGGGNVEGLPESGHEIGC